MLIATPQRKRNPPRRRLGLFISPSADPHTLRIGPIDQSDRPIRRNSIIDIDAFSIHTRPSDAEYLAREFGYPHPIDTNQDIHAAWAWLMNNASSIDADEPARVSTDTDVLDLWPFE